ncbi:ribbon-helix-helix domain-containing protein [soil metagenome]
MRTTVNIDEHLLAEARQLATRSRRSLGDVVDDALRVLLSEPATPPSGRTQLPVFGSGGLRPGVDLEAKEALAALLDEPSAAESPHAAG